MLVEITNFEPKHVGIEILILNKDTGTHHQGLLVDTDNVYVLYQDVINGGNDSLAKRYGYTKGRVYTKNNGLATDSYTPAFKFFYEDNSLAQYEII